MAAVFVETDGEKAAPRPNARSKWKTIGRRVKAEVAKDNLSIIAAGVAFYGFLSIFPALAATVSIYGLVTEPVGFQQHMSAIQSVLPPEAAGLVNDQLQRLLHSRQTNLGWSLIIGLVLAIWSAAKGMSSIFAAMNIAYDEEEKRGWLKLTALALALTLAAILFVTLFLFVIVGLPLALNFLPFGDTAAIVIFFVRWPLMACAALVALAVLYRYAPCRARARWQWISWGAVFATVLWLMGSALFSLYVSNFSSYNSTYGSLGVVVILMTWLLLSAYCVLLGAEINAEIERQTKATFEEKARSLHRRVSYAATEEREA